VKIELDENITAAAKSLFDAHGHDCHTVADEALTGAPDTRRIDVCRSQERMPVTFDVGSVTFRRIRLPSTPGSCHDYAIDSPTRPCALRGLLATKDPADLTHG
jgi:Domain of unknown function (DUF5615)